jgi:hypothetical protein
VKQQISLSPAAHYRGYQVLGANVTRYEGGYQRDWNEAIDLYREESPDAVKVREGCAGACLPACLPSCCWPAGACLQAAVQGGCLASGAQHLMPFSG